MILKLLQIVGTLRSKISVFLDKLPHLALVLHRLLERTLADAGEEMTAERIVTALAD